MKSCQAKGAKIPQLNRINITKPTNIAILHGTYNIIWEMP